MRSIPQAMKKKWIIRILLTLVLLFVVVVVAVGFSLGAVLKKAVERIGPDATKVDVKLKGAGVWIVGGRIELTGFFLGNPSGYTMPSSVTADVVSLRVKARSIFSNKLVVESLKLKNLVVTIEGGLSDNNLKKIEKNMDDYIGSSSTAPNSSASSSSPAKSERKLQVNDLEIIGGKLQINMKILGSKPRTLTIPDIHLTDLGTTQDGITAAEVGQRALHAVLVSGTQEIAKNFGHLGNLDVNDAKNTGKKIGDTLKGFFHRASQ